VIEGQLEEEQQEEENSERWLITYADMITLLMAFFVMMYAMSRINQGRFAALATSIRTEFSGSGLPSGPDITLVNQGIATSLGIVNGTRFGLKRNIEKGLDKAIGDKGLLDHIQVLEVDGNLVIRILSDEVFFRSGSAQLTYKNKEILEHIARILRIMPFEIRVEGHTDSVPIHTAMFSSNWELSTRRATNVVLYFIRTHGLVPDRLSAMGYADTRPIASNRSAAGRQKNRRIDIVIFTNTVNAPTTSAVELGTISSTGSDISIVPPVNIMQTH